MLVNFDLNFEISSGVTKYHVVRPLQSVFIIDICPRFTVFVLLYSIKDYPTQNTNLEYILYAVWVIMRNLCTI